MRPAAPPLLLLLLAAAHASHASSPANDTDPNTLPDVSTLDADAKNDTLETITLANGTVIQIDPANSTLEDTDDGPIVRKKRTFGDIVFRGLADVLGYNVQRRPPQPVFPPPVAPVPGIDVPLQAGPAPAAPAAPPPCGAPRAAGPPPCRAQKPPPPKPTPPPCPQPRAAPKPRPPPPPPPPPPCPKPRANPATPAPCAPAPPPPPKQQADSNLETISSNFQLNFNFVRSTPGPAVQADDAANDDADDQTLLAPIPIQPRAARLPPAQPRQPRVYVDAFVLKNGVPQKVNTVDAKAFNPQQAAAEEDYLAYDDEETQQADDDYEDVQESRDQSVKQFGDAVSRFWAKKKKLASEPLPEDHYQEVHFGSRPLANQNRRSGGRESHQSLQRSKPNRNTIHLPLPEAEPEEDAEVTTTTEDPRRPLKPRVLPPTEHNPGQIDTVTVRVPPIYKEKRPRKLHRERPEQPDRDEYSSREAEDSDHESQSYRHHSDERDSEGENTVPYYRTEAPIRRRRRRKQNRTARSADQPEQAERAEKEDVEVLFDFDYFGKKLPISKEEEFFRGLTIPPPTKDPDLARVEDGAENQKNGHFLDDHERLREDPERISNSGRLDNSGRTDDSGKTDDSGRFDERKKSSKGSKRSENLRADESERSERLSPNARVHETGYRNNYVHAKNVQVDDPRPLAAH